MKDTPERKTHSLDEVAKILGVSKSTAYEAAKSGQLTTIRVGRRWLMPVAALERLTSDKPDKE